MDWQRALEGMDIYLDEPMAKHTSFKVGGPADCLLMARGEEDICAALRVARENKQSVTIVGNGTNLLVRDRGIRGLVIKIGPGMRAVRREGNSLRAQAGASLASLAAAALEQELSGLEFAAGIPGHLGGALTMNAGAYGEEMAGVVQSVRALTMRGESLMIPAKDMRFGYRHSIAQEQELIFLSAKLALTPGVKSAIRAKMTDLAARRSVSQPLRVPSAGSTFKRPEGHFAGKLIEDAGMKGVSVGAAQVSPQHAGFIVNNGGATARDILGLIQLVQVGVYTKFSVRLEPEVRILGEE